VPIISSFYGIAIYMYFEANAPHKLPHFHAYYGEHIASFSIEPPNLLERELPRRQRRLVLAWAELHQTELMQNWQLARDGRLPRKIAGL
jgi:hypothetical protein